jgi:hypothetical protein
MTPTCKLEIGTTVYEPPKTLKQRTGWHKQEQPPTNSTISSEQAVRDLKPLLERKQ